MAEAYSEIALDHFNNPRNVGEMGDADLVGHAENPASGASLDLYFKVEGGGKISEVSFKAYGCTATIAAGSAATELLTGRVISDSPLLTRKDLYDALDGLPPTRKHAFRLVTDAVQSAVETYSGSDSISDFP